MYKRGDYFNVGDKFFLGSNDSQWIYVGGRKEIEYLILDLQAKLKEMEEK